MHELSITQNIVAIVTEHAKDQRVKRVKLQIGTLTSVVPDAVRFCFDVCSKGTPAEGAELEIQVIEARGVCNQCDKEMALTVLAGVCECGSRNIRCVSGEELNVKEMEVA